MGGELLKRSRKGGLVSENVHKRSPSFSAKERDVWLRPQDKRLREEHPHLAERASFTPGRAPSGYTSVHFVPAEEILSSENILPATKSAPPSLYCQFTFL